VGVILWIIYKILGVIPWPIWVIIAIVALISLSSHH
jgi:hypothetical protein